MENKFSIICPVFNTEKYVGECISSVLNQEYKNWELILVDDCSSDASYEICRKYKSKNIKILKNDTNCGQYYSRIKGIKEASGNKIVFLDSDDLLTPDALKKLNSLYEQADWDLISFNYLTFSNEDVPLRKDRLISSNSKIIGEKQVINAYFFKYFLLSLCNTCFDKNLFNYVKLEAKSQKFGEDSLFLSEIIKGAKNAALISDVLYKYRMVSSSITHKMDSNLSFARITNLNKIYSGLGNGFKVQKKYQARFTWSIFNYILDCAKEFDFKIFRKKIKEIKEIFIYKNYFTLRNLKNKKALVICILTKLNLYRLCYNLARKY